MVPGVIWENFTCALFDESFELFYKLHLVSSSEVAVHDVLAVLLVLELFDDGFKWFMVFTFALLHAENDITIHLNKTAIAIPSEALVLGCGSQSQNRLIIQPQIQDGVHHAWHGVTGTGAHCNEEWHALGVTKLAVHDFFHGLHARFHLSLEACWVSALVCIVIGANFGCDCESGRNRKTNAAHLCEIRAFASEQCFHGTATIGFSVAEGINIFCLAAVALCLCHRCCRFNRSVFVNVIGLGSDN